MIWAATLLSISGYSWYLVLHYHLFAFFPSLWAALTGLVFLAVLPTWLGFFRNRALLASRPTVFKMLVVNIVQLALYAALLVAGNYLGKNYFFPAWVLKGSDLLLPFSCLLFSWLCGTFFLLNHSLPTTLQPDTQRPVNVKVMEQSLVIILTAVYLLTFMGIPALLLFLIICAWFFILNLSLAVEGRGAAAPVLRFDIVLLHFLLPLMVALVFLVLAFSAEARFLLLAAQKAILTLIGLLLKLLGLLFSNSPGSTASSPDLNIVVPIMPEQAQQNQEVPLWLLFVFLTLGLLLASFLLYSLIKLLKSTLNLTPISGNTRRSLRRSKLPLLRRLLSLVRYLIRRCFHYLSKASTMLRKLLQYIKKILSRWLPAKTPSQGIFRSYETFLILAQKSGYPRKNSETPLEFAGRLEKSIAGKSFPSEEIRRLTSLFLEAHYSNKPACRQQAAESVDLLARIRSGFKK